jgi:hypothetical protein
MNEAGMKRVWANETSQLFANQFFFGLFTVGAGCTKVIKSTGIIAKLHSANLVFLNQNLI